MGRPYGRRYGDDSDSDIDTYHLLISAKFRRKWLSNEFLDPGDSGSYQIRLRVLYQPPQPLMQKQSGLARGIELVHRTLC